MAFITCDEVGRRIAGFTVRDAQGVRLYRTMADVIANEGADGVWASVEDAMVFHTRKPAADWGDFTTSVQVRYWDSDSRSIKECGISRCSTPWDRCFD